VGFVGNWLVNRDCFARPPICHPVAKYVSDRPTSLHQCYNNKANEGM
jgi:hypothetical protein